MTTPKLNPKMLTVARESRGLTQIELAEKLSLSPSNISRMEQDFIEITPANFTAIVGTLNYPEEFFYQEGETLPPALALRKRNIVAQKIMLPVEAQVNIYRLNVEKLLKAISYPEIDLPVLDIEKLGSPAEAARKLRKLWKIEKGAINNLTQVLEDNGLFLINFDFNTDRVDGMSILADSKFPVVFSNKRSLGDRQRFTLAYELGHLVMHLKTNPPFTRDISHEANEFAAEFLMPEKDIKGDFKDGVTLNILGDLKRKWKLSMQALLYRANDIGVITDNQKRYLINQFNSINIRRREPAELDIARENPMKLRDMITNYKHKQKLNVKQLALFFNSNEDEFLSKYS
ncbi:MAG: ImmA/IrrE family metallo-endopeptidase [Chitinophagaceae bacterium]|nr:ImmA/IrrE family metallo-endopeptidase [Chitinophagaceae bacterium]